jgi:hypothetical protein
VTTSDNVFDESEYEQVINGEQENKFENFYNLMSFRITNVLVISSLYDDYTIQQDISYSEALFEEYNALNLSMPPPRITRVSTAEAALLLIEERQFDMVITMSRIGGINPFELGAKIKKVRDVPIILLLTSYGDVTSLPPDKLRTGIDDIFVYTGNSDLFLAIIKQVEDRKNIDIDTKIGKTRVILVVEDTIAYYSIFLPLIYKELVRQTKRLIAESLNQSHRLLLIRGRPKIILAKTYEQAEEILKKYEEYIFAVITDFGFPMYGTKNLNAGYTLVKNILKKHPYMPILMQSSEKVKKQLADELHVDFVYKHSPRLLNSFTKFLDQIGFGDFTFRTEDKKSIAKAKNFKEFSEIIKTVPVESIIYHGQRHHFSNWLFARIEFDLAYQLRSVTVDDFDYAEEIREFLINFFSSTQSKLKLGVIAEFSKERFDGTGFYRYGGGSLGGKGRGLAFSASMINRTRNILAKKYPNIRFKVPETIVIATRIFDEFIEENDLWDLVLSDQASDENKLKEIILSKNLPKQFKNDLLTICARIKYPIAVRSSSLLEDSQFQPFAGIYSTYMLPNIQKNAKERAKFLAEAIKLVFASTFTSLAKSYIETLGQKIEIEKMAVVIQRIVGKQYEDRFYPHISGVAQSYNYYPTQPMKAKDGIVHIALGLGKSITEGRKYLSFCPIYPKILSQFYSPETVIKNSQSSFFAVEMKSNGFNLSEGESSTLQEFSLDVALKDGVLNWLGAVVDFENNRVIDSVNRPGPLVLTFPSILKYNRFPLGNIMIDLLELSKKFFGCEVEIEFAINLDYIDGKHEFNLLQIRPLVTDIIPFEMDISKYKNKEKSIVYSSSVLGNGIFDGINDIVYIKPDLFKSTNTITIKNEISLINEKLGKENKEYILIGPGRWGTSDRFLGIPVLWNQIKNARAIVEAALEDFQIDPSGGSHFTLNITSSRKGYFTVPYNKPNNARIDWEWLESQKVIEEKDFIKHVELEESISMIIDGKKGEGVILKPFVSFKVDENSISLE